MPERILLFGLLVVAVEYSVGAGAEEDVIAARGNGADMFLWDFCNKGRLRGIVRSHFIQLAALATRCSQELSSVVIQ